MVRIKKDDLFKRINYVPHKSQLLIHQSKERFRVLIAGRRFGKSLCAAMEAVYACMTPDSHGWIVAPNYHLSEKVFRYIIIILNKQFKGLIEYQSLFSQKIKLHNGSRIEGKSCDNPVSLLGEGLDWLIVDEASQIKNIIWVEFLRPTLADRKGWALFTTTPKGKGWVFDLFLLGQKKEKGFESWHFISQNNPYLDPAEIALAKEQTPSDVFAEQWLAEFMEEEDLYFGYELINSCVEDYEMADMEASQITQKMNFVLGVDLARFGEDESVFTILAKATYSDAPMRVMHISSTKQKRLTDAIERIKFLDQYYFFDKIYIDSTGLGGGVIDVLKQTMTGGKIVEFNFSLKSKMEMYGNLKLLLEKKELILPKHDLLLAQMKDLRYENTNTGIKIHHAESGHDDYADSLALACYHYKQKKRYAPVMGIVG